MRRIHRFLSCFALVTSAGLLAGCQTSNNDDSTPPGFVQVVVRLESPTPPNQRGEMNITSSNVSRTGLASDISLRVIATAGDQESGIKDIQIESELRWQCSSGSGAPIIGVLETKPLTFTPAPSFTGDPLTPRSINAVAEPIAATGCSSAQKGHGPVNIAGFVRVTAINGKDLKATSATFIFDYADVGAK